MESKIAATSRRLKARSLVRAGERIKARKPISEPRPAGCLLINESVFSIHKIKKMLFATIISSIFFTRFNCCVFKFFNWERRLCVPLPPWSKHFFVWR